MNIFTDLPVRVDKKSKTLSYFSTKNFPIFTKTNIKELIKIFSENKNNDVRICLHKSPEDLFHQMIIIQSRGEYRRPHKELSTEETYYIVQGKMAIFLFDDEGQVTKFITLSPKDNLIFRNNINQWHVVYPLSSFVIFHEIKRGPFLGIDSYQYPKWAPDSTDKKISEKYMKSLLNYSKKI